MKRVTQGADEYCTMLSIVTRQNQAWSWLLLISCLTNIRKIMCNRRVDTRTYEFAVQHVKPLRELSILSNVVMVLSSLDLEWQL